MKTRMFLGIAVLILTSCRQVTDVRQLNWMVGKCVRFNARVPVVRSRGDRIAARHVLPSADPREAVGTLPAGTVARICRVVYEENVDYTRVEVIGAIGDDQYAITHLFESDWVSATRHDMDERRSPPPPILRSRYGDWTPCAP